MLLSAFVVSYCKEKTREAETLKIGGTNVKGVSAIKKHTYRAKKINGFDWNLVKKQLSGKAAVFAIDAAYDWFEEQQATDATLLILVARQT